MAVVRPILTVLVLFAVGSAWAAEPSPGRTQRAHFAAGEGSVLVSTHSAARYKAGAGTDTFFLYGGPGSLQGKFEDASGLPLTAAQLAAEGWEFVDVTDQPTLWHRSTFNMATLGGHGAGNHGMWAGFSAVDQPGWTTPPGYGNSWSAAMDWWGPMADPSVGQTVELDFLFHHDSEPAYDFFQVQYDSAGTWITVYSRDGTDKGPGGFTAPGVQYALEPAAAPIVYAGNDYAGGNSSIRIRMAALSDGAWSDEDGLWDSDGFAQVDDIEVVWNDGAAKTSQVSFEDFEGPGPYAWVPEKAPLAGYFGQVFAGMTDTDPCRENRSPAYGFMDDGTGPFNPSYSGTGTGGATSLNWTYGVPGGWVVNYSGGVSSNTLVVDNELVTPVIPWDLPGAGDDGPTMAGARIRFSVWEHLPYENVIVYQWSVAARDAGSGNWTAWQNRNFVYYGETRGRWRNVDLDVSDLVSTPNWPDAVRVQLAVRDLSYIFWWSNDDATPSPVFDNVTVLKYRVGGPVIAAKSTDLFQDSFSQSGFLDASSESARDALDVRLDMARDVNTGAPLVAGDSVVVDVTSIVPGHTVDIADVRLHWALHRNPYFEDAVRANLLGFPGVAMAAGSGQNGWDVFTGEVVASQSATSAGQAVPGRFFFDLPDQDFLYPGDVFQYHIEAEDSGGLVSTLPADVTGFATSDKSAYDPAHTVAALPTITAAGQPDLLVIDDRGHGPFRDELLSALGGEPGVDFDLYTVRAPTSGVSNGIGSAGGLGRGHGATAPQLAGYACIVYEAGDLDAFLLSDGTDTGGNDKGDDLGVLTTWYAQDADRYLALFGDAIASAHASAGTGTPAGDTFRTAVLGVDYLDADVRDEIGGSTAPLVAATGLVPGFVEGFVAYGGCLGINTFDSIDPRPGAVASHTFTPGAGGSARTAGVVWDRLQSDRRKVSITFPFGVAQVWNSGSPNPGGQTDRAVLMEEILAVFGQHPLQPVDVDPVARPGLDLEPNTPNPFNPRTAILFSLGVEGPVTARVYDVRGRLVRTLAKEQPFPAGRSELVWDGSDGTGRPVASGVYLARIIANGEERRVKMALVR